MKVLTIVFRVGQDTHEALVNITEHKLGIRELQSKVSYVIQQKLIMLRNILIDLIDTTSCTFNISAGMKVPVNHRPSSSFHLQDTWMLLSEFTGFNLNHFLVFLASLLASNPSFFLLRPSFSSFPQVETKGSQDPSETRQCPVYIL